MATYSFDSQDGSDLILKTVRTLTPVIRMPCEMLWTDWRDDWETELRRIHQSASNASLSLGRLNDFSYLCWSISNTWEDVFSPYLSRMTLDMLHQLRKLRNRAAHQEVITDYHIEQLEISDHYLTRSFGDLLEDIGVEAPILELEPPTPPASSKMKLTHKSAPRRQSANTKNFRSICCVIGRTPC